MRKDITWVTVAGATDQPMGMQQYELQIHSALQALSPAEWRFLPLPITSLRSDREGARRIPMGLLERGSMASATAIGRWAYRGAERVHRFDLRLPPASVPEVVTIHDLAPLHFPDEGRLADWSMRSASRAVAAICPSAFAAEEVKSTLGIPHVVVAPNGIDKKFIDAKPLDAQTRARLGVPEHYVMHAGGAGTRKNLEALAAAWIDIHSEFGQTWLVLVGPADRRRDLIFGKVARAAWLGYPRREDVAGLMASAACVVVPSRYEGFGLPALEAMAAGAPVVAAAASSLPEVCGDAALLVSPDATGLAEGLRSVLGDNAMAAHLRTVGRVRAQDFTWEASARAHLAAYRAAFA